MDRSKIDKNLKEVLAMNGVSQSALAKMLNLKHSTICGWCTGVREPSLFYVAQICTALQCEPNDLLGDYIEGWNEESRKHYMLPTEVSK